ncbi:unnamed protein product [Protopolystoma xenopodis]|uniref:Uncharacterized protein n=1 Tax=Protopolystoma xenopodis TaxID=117903 RepID=A0A448WUX7_9PLAT|nr:unnamed protein product [Protopolystoma xenopodis]
MNSTISSSSCICLDHLVTQLFRLLEEQRKKAGGGLGSSSTSPLVSESGLSAILPHSSRDHSSISHGPNRSAPRLISVSSVGLANCSHLSNGPNTTSSLPLGVAGLMVWAARTELAEQNLLAYLKMPGSAVPPAPSSPSSTVAPSSSPSAISSHSSHAAGPVGNKAALSGMAGCLAGVLAVALTHFGMQLLRRMLVTLLSSVMYEDCRDQWSISRPLLGLILLNFEVN